MKLSTFLRSSVMTFFLVLISSFGVQAQTTAFTYQGRLTDASMPTANGTYDFEFALFSASTNGTQKTTATANRCSDKIHLLTKHESRSLQTRKINGRN